jgi:formate hydrogenlyase subunit 4
VSSVAGLLALLLHLALVLAGAPLLLGLLRLIKARMVGRTGPPVLQPWRDLLRLMRKQPVVGDGTSWLFRSAPAVALAATCAAAALVPSFALGMTTAPVGDLLVIGGLLALGRAVLALAAMDSGTAFGGIGASREMTFSVFAEPVFFLTVFTLALITGSTNLDTASSVVNAGVGLRISMALGLVATLTLAIAECGRVPVDNPASHLELTMVHEAMVLEYSGRHLAMIEFAAALKLLLWMSLIAVLFCPFGIAPHDGSGATLAPWLWLLGIVAWAAKMVLLAALLAVFETIQAKMRVFRVPELLGMALLLGLLAVIFLFVSQGFAQGAP